MIATTRTTTTVNRTVAEKICDFLAVATRRGKLNRCASTPMRKSGQIRFTASTAGTFNVLHARLKKVNDVHDAEGRGGKNATGPAAPDENQRPVGPRGQAGMMAVEQLGLETTNRREEIDGDSRADTNY